jgi:hypothetical protein
VQTLTVNQACEVSGVNPQTLRNWVSAGVIEPAEAGTTGTGKGHRFSVMQVIAMCAGRAYWDEGADGPRCAATVRYLAGLTLEYLEAELADGRSFPVPGTMFGKSWMPGLLVTPPKSPEIQSLVKKLDLRNIKAEVLRKIAALGQQTTTKKQRRK